MCAVLSGVMKSHAGPLRTTWDGNYPLSSFCASLHVATLALSHPASQGGG